MTGQLQKGLVRALVGLSVLLSGWSGFASGAIAATPDDILAEINRARTSPTDYANWLQTLRAHYEGAAFRFPGERGIRTVEGVAALDSAISALSQNQPLPPLSMATGLNIATQSHLTELLNHDRFTLTGLDGSTPLARAEAYGSLGGGRLVESLNPGFEQAEAVVAFLLIDDGNRTRSTQSLVLSSEMTQIGAACGSNAGSSPLCVFDYATQYRSNDDAILDTQTLAVATEPTENPAENQTAASSENSTSVSWSGAVSPDQLNQLSEELVVEINRLRADPAAYAQGLIRLRSYYEGNLVKVPGQPVVQVQEGISALDEAITALQNTESLALLNPSPGMEQGAADHSEDIGFKGLTGHYGSDNSDPFERINRYGTWSQAAAENITYGAPTSAEWHLIQLLVDDGVPSRGHRETLLNPAYQRVGSACAPHAVYRIVCVMTHANDYRER
ncbi:MAG: CAP domain-containing protein [Cyanobacteria bacterium J06621_11]